MVEYKRRFVLSGTRRELEQYSPPRGINMVCWEFDDYAKQAFTQFICNSETPTIRERRTMEDIDNEIARLKVVCDRVRRYPAALDQQQQRFECNLDELNGELDKLRRTSSKKSQTGFGDINIG